MTAVMAQMFAGREPLNEETAFDIEFTDEHIVDGIYCQVQFEITPRAGFDAVGVDWGDGTKQDWPKASRTMAHNWSARGRYRVRLDRRLKWFRFTTAYAIYTGTSNVRAVVRPYVEPVAWGDFVESAQGTYCGWRGLRGKVPKWGKSITTAFCCYQGGTNLTGGFPKWGPSFTDCTGVYDGCSGLGGTLPPWPKEMAKCDQCYQNTLAEGAIPAWPANVESGRMCYKGCAALVGAWTDDPLLLMPETMNGQEGYVTDHDDVVSGTGEALRALFYEDWGGTKIRE